MKPNQSRNCMVRIAMRSSPLKSTYLTAECGIPSSKVIAPVQNADNSSSHFARWAKGVEFSIFLRVKASTAISRVTKFLLDAFSANWLRSMRSPITCSQSQPGPTDLSGLPLRLSRGGYSTTTSDGVFSALAARQKYAEHIHSHQRYPAASEDSRLDLHL